MKLKSKKQQLNELNKLIKDQLDEHDRIKKDYFFIISELNDLTIKNMAYQKQTNRLFGINKQLKSLEMKIQFNMLKYERLLNENKNLQNR
jgi:small-conductance mechanosensitive channel